MTCFAKTAVCQDAWQLNVPDRMLHNEPPQQRMVHNESPQQRMVLLERPQQPMTAHLPCCKCCNGV